VVLILLNGVLAGAEIAIVSSRRSQLMELVERKIHWARSAQALRENPERFLATVQVGITVISTATGAFGGSTLAIHLIPFFQSIPWLKPYAEEVAVGLVVASISYLSIVVGELVPKSLAMRTPMIYGRVVATPLLWLSRISSPAVRLLAASSNLLLKLFGDRTSFTEARLSVEEIRYIVEDAARVGSLHPGTGSIASRALEFSDLTAMDVMVPRHLVISVPAEASLEALSAQLARTPFSRRLVHWSRRDEMLGYLAAKDLVLRAKTAACAMDLLRIPIYVPESLQAIRLLKRLQLERQQMAFVVDEQGTFAGLVTMEDLLEELVGDIFSEFREEAVQEIRWAEDGTAVLPGLTPLREINRHLALDLQDGPSWTTLGGLCLSTVGHVPVPGETITLTEELEAEISSTHGPRIVTVKLQRRRRATDPSAT